MCKCVCADWLPQTCGRREAVANKITGGNTNGNEYNLLKQLQHNSLLNKIYQFAETINIYSFTNLESYFNMSMI